MKQLLPNGQTIEVIHFVFQVGPERIACMPNMAELHATKYHPHYQRTNAREAVTCLACKNTEAYKQA